MKQATFLWACCLVWIFPAHAQTLQGIIVDRNDKTPIQGVSVFFDGTSLYTITDEQGRFSLPVKQKINTSLMVSHLSYQPQAFPYPYADLPDSLMMEEKALTFQPIVVSIDVFGRKQKLNVFRRHFLGETLAGKSCRILNEDDIQLTYDVNDNILYATSDNPIIVYNKYLQYTVSYNLESFYTQYARKTLTDRYMVRYHISGSSSFTDEAPDDTITLKRRNRTYERSYASFFNDLVHGKLNKHDTSSLFRVLGKDLKSLKIDQAFPIRDSLNLHAVYVNISPDTQYDTVSRDGQKIYGQILAIFKKYVRSDITFFNPVFLLDDYGNFDNRSGIFFDGDMARQRIGDMLPRDYRPVRLQQ